jgi:hypothetical protein
LKLAGGEEVLVVNAIHFLPLRAQNLEETGDSNLGGLQIYVFHFLDFFIFGRNAAVLFQKKKIEE